MPRAKGDILTCDFCGGTEIAEDAERWTEAKDGRVYCDECMYSAQSAVDMMFSRGEITELTPEWMVKMFELLELKVRMQLDAPVQSGV